MTRGRLPSAAALSLRLCHKQRALVMPADQLVAAELPDGYLLIALELQVASCLSFSFSFSLSFSLRGGKCAHSSRWVAFRKGSQGRRRWNPSGAVMKARGARCLRKHPALLGQPFKSGCSPESTMTNQKTNPTNPISLARSLSENETG